METPDLMAYGADNVHALAHRLLEVMGAEQSRVPFTVRSLSRGSLVLDCATFHFDDDVLKLAVERTYSDVLYPSPLPGTTFLDSLKLWDRLGYDFRDGVGQGMIDVLLFGGRIEEHGKCIEFLMGRGCMVLSMQRPLFLVPKRSYDLRARLVNLCLIPVLLRPRWLKSKRLPAVLVRMVKEMLTGL